MVDISYPQQHQLVLPTITFQEQYDDRGYLLPIKEVNLEDEVTQISDVGTSSETNSDNDLDELLLDELLSEASSGHDSSKELECDVSNNYQIVQYTAPKSDAVAPAPEFGTTTLAQIEDTTLNFDRDFHLKGGSETDCYDRYESYGLPQIEVAKDDIVDEEVGEGEDTGSAEESSVESSAVDDDDEKSEASDATGSLLAQVQNRLVMQQLHEEVARLEEVVAQKNTEIEQLSGQLRRAVATKCDLVIAHTELERHHEFNLACRDNDVSVLKSEKNNLVESQTEVELTLLNELIQLNEQVENLKRQHQLEFEDWERLHRNELLEKEYQIATMAEEIRQLKGRKLMVPSRDNRSNMPFRR